MACPWPEECEIIVHRFYGCFEPIYLLLVIKLDCPVSEADLHRYRDDTDHHFLHHTSRLTI